jgi:hypothetical protein
MVWKSIYYFYIFLAVCLIVGIVLALVFGLNNNNNSNKLPEPSASITIINTRDIKDTKDTTDTTLYPESTEYAESTNNPPQRVFENTDPLVNTLVNTLVESEKSVIFEKSGQSEISTILNIIENPVSSIISPVLVEPLRIDSIELKLQTSVHIARDISPSFGLAISHIDHFVVVGAPMDETYGKVWIYEYNMDAQLVLRHTLKFHLVGSIYQQAGFAIQRNIIAAPNFALKSDARKVPEGTLFLIDRYNTSHPEMHRLTTDLKDNHYMVKHGQIFAFTPPYVWVTKTQESAQCVDVYQLDTTSQHLQFLQRLTVSEPDNMFGHSITQMSHKHTIFISDPLTNNYYCYAKNDLKFALQTRINSNDLLPLEDLNQICALQPQGDLFMIASPANHLVLIYYATTTDQWNLLQTLSIDPDMTITGLDFISDSTFTILFASKTISWYRQHSDTKQFQYLGNHSFVTDFPFTEINHNLLWVTPKTMLACGIAELDHDGQLSVYHT